MNKRENLSECTRLFVQKRNQMVHSISGINKLKWILSQDWWQEIDKARKELQYKNWCFWHYESQVANMYTDYTRFRDARPYADTKACQLFFAAVYSISLRESFFHSQILPRFEEMYERKRKINEIR